MATYKLLLLPGDGIGPEVMAEVKRLLGFLAKAGIATFETEEGLVGGCCYDAHKISITEETMAKAGRNGTTCPTTCGRKRGCCACARI
jgi:3-isopropylmalate dehydrogenase